jgi:hypothetical protein
MMHESHLRHGATAFLAALALAAPGCVWSQAIEVKDIWLKRNCFDKGTGDHPLAPKEFEACLRKQVEGLPPLDPNRREFFGERYDPPKYVECRMRPGNRANSACNVYILRRREWPEYWPPGAVRPKWPDAPKESVYRKGMTPRQYWEALCKAEAGEFIYRGVKDVEGFLLIRPRGQESDYAIQDRAVIEDGYGLLEFQFSQLDRRPGRASFALSRNIHRFVETGAYSESGSQMWLRHEIDLVMLEAMLANANQKWSEEQFSRVTAVPSPKSIYGVIWRGIRRKHDVEMGISGGELGVLDLRSGDVVALRRGFALDVFAARGATSRRYWLSSAGCPAMRRDSLTFSTFIRSALLPKGI